MEHRHDLSVDELRAFHKVATEADDLLEECLRDRCSLRATLTRFLPAFERWMKAKAVLLATQDESLHEDHFTWGDAATCEKLRHSSARIGGGVITIDGGDTLLWQELELAGVKVALLRSEENK